MGWFSELMSGLTLRIWHPIKLLDDCKSCAGCFADKNQQRVEEAEEKFREVQNAYEVLSDKHERAW